MNAGKNTPADAYSACSNTDGVPYASGLFPLPCAPLALPTPITFYNDYGADLSPTITETPKAKVTIRLPSLRVRAFNILCYSQPPPFFPPCPFNAHFPKADPTVTTGQYYGTFASAWVRSPKGVRPQYGVFPAVKVSLLAFGSIPVSATVHITQPYVNGVSTPQTLAWVSSANFINAGAVIPGYAKYGGAPGSNYFFSPPAKLSGPVDIRVDHVKVDGVALSVGASCSTSSTLHLGAPGGFYQQAVTVRGKPGAWQPLLNAPSYPSGHINLPAFDGCRNGTEDLDPLITGMVSGPGNKVYTTQLASLTNYGCLVNPTHYPACSSQHPALAKNAATSTNLQASAAASLSPAQLAALKRYTNTAGNSTKYLPPALRKVLAS